MALRIVSIIPGYAGDEEACRKIGAEIFHILCKTEDELIAATQDADAILTNSRAAPLTREVISKLRKCKLIHNFGQGYDSIDVKAATDYGICVSFPGDYCSEEVSEHAMTLILACARKLVRFDRAVREGKWTSASSAQIRQMLPPIFQIRGQTLGIIGFGRIGRLIVPKAKGFGLRVIAFDPYVPSDVFKELGVESVTLDHLLGESDFVSVNAALTEENRHLLGIEEFKKMKPTAYFTNCARAAIADEEALYTALNEGYIAGAGLDVVEGNVISLDHPLLKLENVILTPHIAYYSEYAFSEIRRRPYEQFGLIFSGEWPTRLVNSEVKEKFLERWGKDWAKA